MVVNFRVKLIKFVLIVKKLSHIEDECKTKQSNNKPKMKSKFNNDNEFIPKKDLNHIICKICKQPGYYSNQCN